MRAVQGARQVRETEDVQRYLHALHSRARQGALIEVRYDEMDSRSSAVMDEKQRGRFG